MQNVLFILTDQWPAWAFGFLGADIPTPNIDRLWHPRARYSQMLSHRVPSAHPLGAHCSQRAGRIKMAFTTTNPWAIPSRNPCRSTKKPGLTKPCASAITSVTTANGTSGISTLKNAAHTDLIPISKHTQSHTTHKQMITPTKKPLPATPTKPKTSSKGTRHFGEIHRNQKKISNPFPP